MWNFLPFYSLKKSSPDKYKDGLIIQRRRSKVITIQNYMLQVPVGPRALTGESWDCPEGVPGDTGETLGPCPEGSAKKGNPLTNPYFKLVKPDDRIPTIRRVQLVSSLMIPDVWGLTKYWTLDFVFFFFFLRVNSLEKEGSGTRFTRLLLIRWRLVE